MARKCAPRPAGASIAVHPVTGHANRAEQPRIRGSSRVRSRTAEGQHFARCLAHPWAGPALLALTCFVALFLGLGDSHLFDPDEGRSAEVAREMLVSGHWLVPTINFGQFHDKPALYYWLIAGSMRLFGANDYAVRLPGVIAATLTVIATGCGPHAISADRRGCSRR